MFLAAITGAAALTPWLGVFIARNAWVASVTRMGGEGERSAWHTTAAYGGVALVLLMWGGLDRVGGEAVSSPAMSVSGPRPTAPLNG